MGLSWVNKENTLASPKVKTGRQIIFWRMWKEDTAKANVPLLFIAWVIGHIHLSIHFLKERMIKVGTFFIQYFLGHELALKTKYETKSEFIG